MGQWVNECFCDNSYNNGNGNNANQGDCPGGECPIEHCDADGVLDADGTACCARTVKATAATATLSTMFRRTPAQPSSTLAASATTRGHAISRVPSLRSLRCLWRQRMTVPLFATASPTSVCSGATSASAATRTTTATATTATRATAQTASAQWSIATLMVLWTMMARLRCVRTVKTTAATATLSTVLDHAKAELVSTH